MASIEQLNAESYLACGTAFSESLDYDDKRNILSFMGFFDKSLHLVNLGEGPTSYSRVNNLENSIHKVIPLKSNDDVWLFSSKAVKLGLMNKKTGASHVLIQAPLPQAELEGFLFNDAGVDSRGRLWVGIMPDPFDINSTSGRLWRVDADLSMNEMIGTGLGTPNGLGWSPDEKTFYLNDSVKKAILAFDYDIERGNVSNQRTLWESAQIGPDGLAVDADGSIWVALFQQGKVAKISPKGELIAEVNLPVKTVTDVLFVGEKIFITTAGSEDGSDGSGNVYVCHVGVQGRELYRFALAGEYIETAGGAI